MSQLLPILHIDDERADAILVERACKELKVPNPVIHFFNGKEALRYLKNENNKKPLFILADLNTPEMNAFEFLEFARNDTTLKMIPVVILSGSGDEDDVAKCFALGAVGYMVKPFEYKEMVRMTKTVFEYWNLSQLPNKKQMVLQKFSV